GRGLGAGGGSGVIGGLRVLDVPAAGGAVPAGDRGGRGVRLALGGGQDARLGIGSHWGGRIGHTRHAEGGAADDSGRDDWQREVADEATAVVGVHLSYPVSVDFWSLASAWSGGYSTIARSGPVVYPVIGQRTG